MATKMKQSPAQTEQKPARMHRRQAPTAQNRPQAQKTSAHKKVHKQKGM